MKGKAASQRRIGVKARLLYALGAALATLNALWFGRWMIGKAAAHPDGVIFWASIALFAGLAGYVLTRKIYGYLPTTDIFNPNAFLLLAALGAATYAGRVLYMVNETSGIPKIEELVSEQTNITIAGLAFVISLIVCATLVIRKEAKPAEMISGVLGGTFFGTMVLGLAYVAWQIVSAYDGQGVLIYSGLAILVPTFLFIAPVTVVMVQEYLKEWPFYRNRLGGITGRGGAARFAGFYWFTRLDGGQRRRKRNRARMYMGNTTWESETRLGGREIVLDSDNHMLTVAMTGGGKSYYAAWNVLPEWKGGAFIFDPKGEHTAVTLGARQRLGACHVFDPWNLAEQIKNKATFNPLEEIDLNNVRARSDMMQIVDACIEYKADSNESSEHFRESARTIFLGIMVHVLTRFPAEHHNLPAIYDTFLMGHPDHGAANPQDFADLVTDMGTNEAVGKAPMDAAKILLEAADRERGGFMTTLSRNLRWTNDPAIRPAIQKSSMKMRNLKQRGESFYLVAPFEYMSEHRRLMRCVLNMALLSCREDTPKDRERVLFCLDEFAQLGFVKSVVEGLDTSRGRDVKLWVFFQKVEQMKGLYGSPSVFTASCDTQFFAVNDQDTKELISDMCGDYVESYYEGDSYNEHKRPLRTPKDVGEELAKDSGFQYVFAAGVPSPLRLGLVPFKKRHRNLPNYKAAAAPKSSVEQQKREQHDRSKAIGLAHYWGGILEGNPHDQERREAISQLKGIGGDFAAEYLINYYYFGLKPGISKTAYDEAIRELERLEFSQSLPSFEELNGRAASAEPETAEDAPEATTEPQDGAKVHDMNDARVRRSWETFDPEADYGAFYDRHGDSLSREEMEQLQKHMAEQERRMNEGNDDT